MSDNRPMRRPRLLDLFCGAGGASTGYPRAGFEVVGVDIEPQPNYPFEFMQADALELIGRNDGFYLALDWEAIPAPPPCQDRTNLKHLNRHIDHEDLVAPTRDLLKATGLPYVIE